MRGRGRLLVGLTAALLAAGAISASAVALRHGGTQQPVSLVVVTPPPSPSQPASADFPAWTPTPVPTATPTAAPTPAPTAAPTPRPTVRVTPKPTSDASLEECNSSIYQETTTATRRSDGSVLIEMAFHRTWSTPCSMPTGCPLGYTVSAGMGGVYGTNQPVNCTPVYVRETGDDLHYSVIWSTCHAKGDYDIAVRLDRYWFDSAQYTSPYNEPPAGCSPPQ